MVTRHSSSNHHPPSLLRPRGPSSLPSLVTDGFNLALDLVDFVVFIAPLVVWDLRCQLGNRLGILPVAIARRNGRRRVQLS